MASLRDTRRRITSVKNTRQITRAMKLVAGAKLRRATEAATAAKPYQQTLSRVLGRVVAKAGGEVEHPLLSSPDNDTDILVAVLASDRGLCGGFNNQLLRSIQADIDALVADGKNVRLLTFGKKSTAHFKKRGYQVEASTVDLDPADYADEADKLADLMMAEMASSGFERAFIAYNDYRSVLSQVPTFAQVLPMVITAEDDGGGGDIIYEPDGKELLGRLLPMALRTQIFQAFLETQAGEQAARMAAMDSATRNASDLIDDLTLLYNRGRQAAITTELTEIVSGAEAL
jgi:F-type H+-transporting ATPase subunit gamma